MFLLFASETAAVVILRKGAGEPKAQTTGAYPAFLSVTHAYEYYACGYCVLTAAFKVSTVQVIHLG